RVLFCGLPTVNRSDPTGGLHRDTASKASTNIWAMAWTSAARASGWTGGSQQSGGSAAGAGSVGMVPFAVVKIACGVVGVVVGIGRVLLCPVCVGVRCPWRPSAPVLFFPNIAGAASVDDARGDRRRGALYGLAQDRGIDDLDALRHRRSPLARIRLRRPRIAPFHGVTPTGAGWRSFAAKAA